MTPIEPSDLPLLTNIVDADGKPVYIPTLTEVIPAQAFGQAEGNGVHLHPETHSIAQMATELIWNADITAKQPATQPERNLNEAEMQQLLQHFEAYLEYVFTTKLNRHLEQLHQQAVKLAISEFKSELPELLRKAINMTDTPP